MANETIHDVLIAGQGAAGYAAAMYAARYQISPVVFGAVFGGETATGGLIENYPGYPEIDGFELMMKFREHAQKYGVPIVDEDAAKIERRSDCFELTTDEGNTYLGASVILAVGRERRTLGLEHEVEWTGRGVSYCSTCDAPLHRDNVVGVVGGGDSAVKGAALLSKYARQVYVIYRRESFTRPEPVNLRQLESSDNVTTLFNTNVVGLLGDDGLDGVVLDRPHAGSSELALNGLFIEIGADPRVELAEQLGVELNELNEVRVDKHGRTNVDGVFAAGDLTDASGDLKQTITAAASGALAATAAYEYVSIHGNRCATHAAGYHIEAAD
jgi:thioredoxin reductase (NADPH)